MLQVVTERMVVGRVVALYQPAHLVEAHLLARRHQHLAIQRVLQPVVDRLPGMCHPLLGAPLVILRAVGHHVVAQRQAVVDEPFHLHHTGIPLLPRRLMLLVGRCFLVLLFSCHDAKLHIFSEACKHSGR